MTRIHWDRYNWIYQGHIDVCGYLKVTRISSREWYDQKYWLYLEKGSIPTEEEWLLPIKVLRYKNKYLWNGWQAWQDY